MTLFEIEVLVHYYLYDTPFKRDEEYIQIPSLLNKFEKAGMLKREFGDATGETLRKTDCLDKYIDAILNIELPVKKLIFEDNQKHACNDSDISIKKF